MKVSTAQGFRLWFFQMHVRVSLPIPNRSAIGALEDGTLALGVLEDAPRPEIPLALDDERVDLDVDASTIGGRGFETDVLLAEVEATEEEDLAHVGLDVRLGPARIPVRQLAETTRKVEPRHLVSLVATDRLQGSR